MSHPDQDPHKTSANPQVEQAIGRVSIIDAADRVVNQPVDASPSPWAGIGSERPDPFRRPAAPREYPIDTVRTHERTVMQEAAANVSGRRFDPAAVAPVYQSTAIEGGRHVPASSTALYGSQLHDAINSGQMQDPMPRPPAAPPAQ